MILRNTCGPGLRLPHRGTIIINGGSKIGANCTIHIDVNIGTTKGCNSEAPTIGNNVYIAPGAKIFGPIHIADNCTIGANAVVNKSCYVEGATIVGIPARIIEK